MLGFIFPGQGSQAPGMGKDFAKEFACARQTFEEADDVLQRRLSHVVFEGSEEELRQTHNSQPAIFVTSVAILRVVQETLSDLHPTACAGHSIGEYAALVACGKAAFGDVLEVVRLRASYMEEACRQTQGGMVALLGVDTSAAEAILEELRLPDQVWLANLNSPVQVVLSGTPRGLEAASEVAKRRGVRKVVPLAVSGAFHSPLMKEAEEKLRPHLECLKLCDSAVPLVMNVTGDYEEDLDRMRYLLMRQVSSPVYWERCVRSMLAHGITRFVEIGVGRVLAGLGKRIGGETTCMEKVEDLK